MKREVRASLVAGQGGVGAVIDVGSESFLIPGIETWKQSQLRVIDLPRLSTRLRKVLKAPKEDSPTLLVRRFPKSMFCEKCRRMVFWQTHMEVAGKEPACQATGCGGALVPMRFVMACENGHLEDIPWERWAHSGPKGNPNCRKQIDELSFVVSAESSTGGLGSLKVQCRCGSSRSLEDIANKGVVKAFFKSCSGNHPWIRGPRVQCDAEPVVLQRGATNLHYPSTLSALDIPSAIEADPTEAFGDQIRAHARYCRLLSVVRSTEGDNGEFIELLSETIATAVGCDTKTVVAVVISDADGQQAASGSSASAAQLDQAVLLEEEWTTLREALHSGGVQSKMFSATAENLDTNAPHWIRRITDGVVLIRRLREVRAYLGFQRVKPGDPDKTVRPDVGASEPWLPASEVFGEGIVLALNFDALERWSSEMPSEEMSALVELEERRISENFWFLPTVDPIQIAIHTLSHLLLRQLTFECGYSSSSLRERLYFSRENRHSAIMIYTADGDSEGSLGGLVRQGRTDRFAQSIWEAVDRGGWCSSDPVCTETAGQGLGGFNRAACHACSLVSETSCTFANTMLDRRMLFDPAWGLLRFSGADQ